MSHRSLAFALTALAACRSEPSDKEPAPRPERLSLEGRFVGDLSIDDPNPRRTVLVGDPVDATDPIRPAIFTDARFELAANGEIKSGAVRTKTPTRPDEVGTATGRIELRSDKRIEIELELTFPTLGVYTAVGDATYVDQELRATLKTRVKEGVAVGDTVLFIHREK